MHCRVHLCLSDEHMAPTTVHDTVKLVSDIADCTRPPVKDGAVVTDRPLGGATE